MLEVNAAGDLPMSEGFALAAAAAELRLPICADCGAVQYPARDTCSNCLSQHLRLGAVSGGGRVVATTVLHRSSDPRFSALLPLRIASIRLDAGPVVIAFLPGDGPADRVQVSASRDEWGQAVLTAVAARPGE